jgi:hypothetical protein
MVAENAQRGMTREEFEEFQLCSPIHGVDGFLRFCAKHVKIQDKRTGRAIPFDLWDCQRAMAGDLVMGLWLLCLKARQMGMTWLVAAYALWRMTYTPLYTVIVIAQSKEYAEDFVVDKLKFMYDHLPWYLQQDIRRETRTRIDFQHGAQIRAFASGKKAARSLTANLFIGDEAAFNETIEEAHRAALPTLERSGGQSVLISTSDGPSGFFYDEAEKAMRGESIDEGTAQAYQFRFWSCFDHPDQDEDWYARMARKHAHRAMHMHYEFPRTPEEAFTAAGGRIYPLFTKQRVPDGHLLELGAEHLRPEWKRYRFLDWGMRKSAMVCLWAVHIPTSRPRLTVHPECEFLCRELIAYAYKKDTTEPDKKNDHGPDALRYGVVTFNLTGHVHVYRELYLWDWVSQGMTTQSVIAKVKEVSGWELSDARVNTWRPGGKVEEYAGTVFDRSSPHLENEFWKMNERAMPHTKPLGDQAGNERREVASGIALVNKLVVGGMPNQATRHLSEKEKQRLRLERRDPLAALGIKTSMPIQDRILANEIRRERARKRRKMRNWAGTI